MKEKSINRKMIIFATLFLGLCMVIPVWQSAVSTRLALRINVVNSEIVALEEQKTQVKAQIERMTDSEYLRQVALSTDSMLNVAGNI